MSSSCEIERLLSKESGTLPHLLSLHPLLTIIATLLCGGMTLILVGCPAKYYKERN